ncbi:M56 family metallopeptidase [Bacillus rubiinfantis]|uniref:M56 family metallopeptidase n=1 Tax=Bacillus rubiinfantis TaxID=1499680 RepID=UPI0005A62D36|nr:M56 family metallopeptidase [Bacillus rubiinfantis]
MLPSTLDIVLFLIIGGLIGLTGLLATKFTKKYSYIVEIIAAILAIGYTFYQYSFPDGFIYIGFISSGYFSLTVLSSGKEKYDEIKIELQTLQVEELELQKNPLRILLDFLIVAVVFSGAILFYAYGPESPLKLLIIFGLVSAVTELIKRFFAYKSVKVFYSSPDESMYIVSPFAARKFPVSDLEQVHIESTVDVLKLHPLLTMFTSNLDFTTSFARVLRLSLPGETVFLTVTQPETWKEKFGIDQASDANIIKVYPFYHKKNLKRLLGKLYFAVTVKGVSAYTGLLLLMYYLQIPIWLLVSITLIYWFLNLYFSDRVLKVAMDADETTDQRVIAVSQRIFEKAGIRNVRVYETESTDYNGLATGMNIGRSMITLTTATLKLPVEAIEGIIAHEAIHVKRRDVMWGQIWRFGFILVLLLVIWLIQKYIPTIEDYKIPLFMLIWFLIVVFPIYQSYYSQWMEVRADHLGASLLEGGSKQMAESLTILANHQDAAVNKVVQYSTVAGNEEEEISSLKRDSLIWRFIEFQFMAHPPMYWRVQTLQENVHGWGKVIWKRWFFDRIRESMTR